MVVTKLRDCRKQKTTFAGCRLLFSLLTHARIKTILNVLYSGNIVTCATKFSPDRTSSVKLQSNIDNNDAKLWSIVVKSSQKEIIYRGQTTSEVKHSLLLWLTWPITCKYLTQVLVQSHWAHFTVLRFIFLVAQWNRADHYIFMLFLLSSFFFLFPRLISAVRDCMSTILPHMVWP